MMKVLAGDIGGTKTLLQISERVICQREYASRTYMDFAALLKECLDNAGRPDLDGACLAVAGPVSAYAHGQSAQLTNLPWQLETRALADALRTPRGGQVVINALALSCILR